MKSIFISSTFKDMNAERDLVLSRVIPDLQVEAKKYGENVNAIDLRWGVDTTDLESDEGSQKILDVCFEKIDKSSPYMLIFLGERYGWIPEESIVRNAVENHAKDFTPDDYKKSVTALEIEYGMLSEKIGNPEKCVVCFRSPEVKVDFMYSSKSQKHTNFTEDKEAGQKLQQLKEKIRQRFGDRIIEYTGKWDMIRGRTNDLDTLDGEYLNEAITKAFLTIFRKEWEERPIRNQIEQEQRYAEAFYEKKLIPFRGRQELVQKYYQEMIEDDSVVLIHGDDGCGKSSLLCKVAEKLQREGKQVFLFFSGISEGSCTINDFLERAIYYSEEVLGEEHKETSGEAELKSRFWNLCNQAEQSIYFCIDALEQLLPEPDEENLLAFVELFPAQAKLVLSCGGDSYYRRYKLPRKEQMETKSGRAICVKKIPGLTAEERLQVIEGKAEFFGKTINPKVILAIEKKISKYQKYDEQVHVPLYIDLILKRLNMMDYEELKDATDEEALVNKCIEIVDSMPNDIVEAAHVVIYEGIDRLVNRFASIYGLRETIDKACSLIPLTKAGIDKEGIEYINIKGMLKGMYFGSRKRFLINTYDGNALEWFWSYMDDFLTIRKGGTIDCVNDTFRKALCNQNPRWMLQLALLEYIDTLDVNDSFRVREGLRQVEELIEHDTIRLVENLSYGKEDGEEVRNFFSKFKVDEEWVYKKAARFFADYEQYENPSLKKTMMELPERFYVKYMDEYFQKDGNTWKVKRRLLEFLLIEYNSYANKLQERILEFLLEEQAAGREDAQLLVLCYDRLKKENKALATDCFNYSEKIYLQDKTWENAKRMWQYCVEVTKDYKYRFLEERYEKDPAKKAVYESDSYQEMDRSRCEDILRVAQEMCEICLEYQKEEEATVLLELIGEICKYHDNLRWIEPYMETSWIAYYMKLEKESLEKSFDNVFETYDQLHDLYEAFSEEMKEKYMEQRIHSLEHILRNAGKADGVIYSDMVEKIDGVVLDFLCDYAECTEETGESYRKRVICFLQEATAVLKEYIKAGCEFKYISLELLEQVMEALSISWKEFKKLAESE